MLFWQRNTRIFALFPPTSPAPRPRTSTRATRRRDTRRRLGSQTATRRPNRDLSAPCQGGPPAISRREECRRTWRSSRARSSSRASPRAPARALTSFTVETADLKIKAPASLAKTYDMAIANFGEPMYGATLRCARRHPPIRSPRSRLTRSRSGDPVHSPRLTHSPKSHRSGGLSYPTTIDASYRNGCQHFVSTPTRPPNPVPNS